MQLRNLSTTYHYKSRPPYSQFLHICSSTPTNSTMDPLVFQHLLLGKKMHKWIHIVQTHVVQGSTVSISSVSTLHFYCPNIVPYNFLFITLPQHTNNYHCLPHSPLSLLFHTFKIQIIFPRLFAHDIHSRIVHNVLPKACLPLWFNL